MPPPDHQPRHNWTRQELRAIYNLPLPELLYRAQSTHRQFHNPNEIQLCRLLSIKTGGCPEDCAYCPQSAHYTTGVPRENLMNVPEVLAAAERAKTEGATRFCMGAAWRDAPQGPEFQSVLEMVSGVAKLKMEVCCTLGMLTKDQARELKTAGLTAYNHNLDTSPEFYGEIIHTRTYEDRLKTLAAVREAGITVCSGGIIGMGESDEDRVGLLHQLANLEPHPESVPINMLVRAQGTPASKSTRSRSPNHGPHDSHSKNRHAQIQSPPSSRPPTTKPRSRNSMLHSRCQLNLHRRKATNHPKSHNKRRRNSIARSRPKKRTAGVPAGSLTIQPRATSPTRQRTAPTIFGP